MNPLLLGVGYFPWLTSGEKNFFFRLCPLLKQNAGVVVFSLNDIPQQELSQGNGADAIPVYCARRPFHRDYERFHFRADAYAAYRHRHTPAWEILEKTLSLFASVSRLRRIVQRHGIDVVHFMDNFGPAMAFLRKLLPGIRVTFSAANYDPRGRLYDRFLKMSLGPLDGLAVYTRAYLQILQGLGVRTYMALTPWGVPLTESRLGENQKRAVREALGIPAHHYFLLWSGYLQQIQEADYYRTVLVAREVVQRRSDVTFVFAFKPETFRPAYSREAGERIKVVSGVEDFPAVLETADLLCSPVGNRLSTVSPPLTWLEAMSRGTPVATTAVGGVDDLVVNGQTGYIARGYDDLASVLVEQVRRNSLALVARGAEEAVSTRYGIEDAAARYLSFWEQVLQRRRRNSAEAPCSERQEETDGTRLERGLRGEAGLSGRPRG